MKYFSMFSGIGGFELGIERATKGKWECVGYSEIDKYAIKTYEKHFPEHKNYGDATNIDTDKLPDFDILCGGFPCQAFSIAGKRLGFKDTRGTLFFEIARIIKAKKPKIVFLENVKGLLSHNNRRTFAVILATFDELGYNVEWQVLNSKHFGVPQNRERVFIIGHTRDGSGQQVFPIRKSNKNITKEFVEKDAKGYSTLTATYHKGGKGIHIISHSPRKGDPKKGGTGILMSNEHSFTIDRTPHYVSILDLYNKKEHFDRCPTLTEPHHNTIRVKQGNKIRKLTPIECERLQGFPDNWTIGSDTQRYKQCGNAVTVNVIEEIIKQVLIH